MNICKSFVWRRKSEDVTFSKADDSLLQSGKSTFWSGFVCLEVQRILANCQVEQWKEMAVSDTMLASYVLQWMYIKKYEVIPT